MSPVHLWNLEVPIKQPEDREGLSRTKRPGRGQLGHSGGLNLKPEDCKDMGQVLQIHQLLKVLFQWSMDNKRFNPESQWAELGESFQKICLKEINFKDLMEITKGWNPTRQFRLLEERETRISENQATIQAIEEKLNQTGHTLFPSGSQGVDQTSSPVGSHHSATNRSVTKSHHSSQSQVISRRRQG
ncbi:hypothetical protein O181_072426 [Austropuccinia psidii MF-1]|uniref:Uncharacterized protein n=1 Tax=Austropuccinia psidii MF-1 TaxID=1389203 RepID=A0A9Q3F2P4_9BASI|nr:hypothetical protein [Austropuccinia psidii MF-1]